jgi:hypothetical protein
MATPAEDKSDVSSPSREAKELYASDEFRIYCMKVLPCSKVRWSGRGGLIGAAQRQAATTILVDTLALAAWGACGVVVGPEAVGCCPTTSVVRLPAPCADARGPGWGARCRSHGGAPWRWRAHHVCGSSRPPWAWGGRLGCARAAWNVCHPAQIRVFAPTLRTRAVERARKASHLLSPRRMHHLLLTAMPPPRGGGGAPALGSTELGTLLCKGLVPAGLHCAVWYCFGHSNWL